MKVELVRYSQDVDIHDPEKAISYLVLRKESGKEFRIQVTAETIRDLVLELEEGKVKSQPTMVVDEERPAPEPSDEDSYYQDNPPPPAQAASEDGVPSL